MEIVNEHRKLSRMLERELDLINEYRVSDRNNRERNFEKLSKHRGCMIIESKECDLGVIAGLIIRRDAKSEMYYLLDAAYLQACEIELDKNYGVELSLRSNDLASLVGDQIYEKIVDAEKINSKYCFDKGDVNDKVKKILEMYEKSSVEMRR